MTWTRKGTRIAALGYLLVVLVVIGGLTWTTLVSLRLERAETERQRWKQEQARLRLALRRMDDRVRQTRIREENRPYADYQACHYPHRTWNREGQPFDQGEVVEISTVLESRFEPWFILHFHVSPVLGVTSPQTPDAFPFLGRLDLAEGTTFGSPKAAETLAVLRPALKFERLEGLLADAQARELAMGPASEYEHRKRQTDQALHDSRPAEVCNVRDLAIEGFDPPFPSESDVSEATTIDFDELVPVTVSGMSAIWLDLNETQHAFLAFARAVHIENEVIAYQGFVLDWPALRSELLADIADLFPQADLVPVETGPVDDPETLMTALPAWLDTTPGVATAAAIGWTPMRTGLLLAWVAAATILAAVGLGVRSLLALAERRRQFAYAVSHELRTPLTTFRLYTDMLAGGLVPEASRQDYLETLNQESERLSDLVAGVLEYSRIEHQAPTLAPAETTVGELLENVRQRFEPQCLQADRKLVVDADGLADRPWHTDPDLVMQIIGTLIDNACKYARDAEDRRIILSASPSRADREGPIRLEVRDFGPGIPKGQRRHIFKPFRRGQ
ncbi:MAG TPA: HAMP domain-containing sensor histidine kinase, partial [Phycisphaerae bacterium]|nr:HAMP domain-containing sensor histidine kinase [Phycisphaerae bacterium]